MSKGKKSSSSGGGGDTITNLDPATIYFTFSRIRARYSCGRTIQSTIDQFLRHEVTVRDIPLLCVLTDGTHYYSQNNRRLYTYKRLREMGELQTVPVRLRQTPQTRRMAAKYTPEKCALTATIMGGGGGGGGGQNENDDVDEEEEREGDNSSSSSSGDEDDGHGNQRGPSLRNGGPQQRQQRQLGRARGSGSAQYRYGRTDSLHSESNLPHSDCGSVGIRSLGPAKDDNHNTNFDAAGRNPGGGGRSSQDRSDFYDPRDSASSNEDEEAVAVVEGGGAGGGGHGQGKGSKSAKNNAAAAAADAAVGKAVSPGKRKGAELSPPLDDVEHGSAKGKKKARNEHQQQQQQQQQQPAEKGKKKKGKGGGKRRGQSDDDDDDDVASGGKHGRTLQEELRALGLQ